MKSTISKFSESIVLTMSIALSGAFAKAIHSAIILPLFNKGKNEDLALITSLSLGLFAATFIYAIYLRFFKKKKTILEDCTFNEKIGIYKHNKTGQSYCGTCMLEGVEAPLLTTDYGWFCQRKGCSKSYQDPEKPKPKQQIRNQRQVVSRGIRPTWLNRW